MKQRQLLPLFLFTLLLAMVGCSDNDSNTEVTQSGHLVNTKVNLPEEFKQAKLYDTKISAFEINSRRTTNYDVELQENNLFIAHLKSGLYNLSFEAKAKLDGKERILKGYLENTTINKDTSIEFNVLPLPTERNFVIEEIFYTGSLYPNSKRGYLGDQYFKITNNSDETLYADGLTIAESGFATNMYQDITPNRMTEEFAVQALYAVPGSGKDHPVLPGESIIICDKAINHKEVNPNSFDFSNADFEWFDESSNPKIQDTDNPEVPNLDKIYSYTLTIWILNMQGNRAYAILRMGKDKETFLAENQKEYSFIYDTGDSQINIKRKAYFVPNEWIIDAVNISTQDEHEWIVTDSSLDASYTYCGNDSNDPNRSGKSVRRKVAYQEADGRRVLQDTNNSKEDFIPTATPSVAE